MEKKYKFLHIGIILIGIVYLGVGIFNNNLWFDEAYSVSLTNHNIIEMCKIAAYDVHPILYYIILKIFVIIFGKYMIVYRIASLIPMIILLIFGYTHIRKEFGKKTGIYFSFLVSFMPILIHYSTQIRMYSWAILFVTLTGYYAYMIIKMKNNRSWILYAIFSISSAYTHYYALFTIGIINLLLLIYIIKSDKENIKKWFVYGIIQILAYIPGIIIFIIQYTKVVKGFWITIKYPEIIFRILDSNFKDIIPNNIPLIISSILYIYILYRIYSIYKETKKETTLVVVPILVCLLVIVFALSLSIIKPVFITRYMLPMIGLFIFSISYILSKENKLLIKLIICISIFSLALYNGYLIFNKNYTKENENIKKEIENNLKNDDIFVFTDIGTGAVISTYFSKNKSYFYNKDNWDVENAYKAFAPQMQCVNNLNDIKNYKGRIWIIDSEYSELYKNIQESQKLVETIQKKEIYNPYSETKFILTLIQKYNS